MPEASGATDYTLTNSFDSAQLALPPPRELTDTPAPFKPCARLAAAP